MPGNQQKPIKAYRHNSQLFACLLPFFQGFKLKLIAKWASAPVHNYDANYECGINPLICHREKRLSWLKLFLLRDPNELSFKAYDVDYKMSPHPNKNAACLQSGFSSLHYSLSVEQLRGFVWGWLHRLFSLRGEKYVISILILTMNFPFQSSQRGF